MKRWKQVFVGVLGVVILLGAACGQVGGASAVAEGGGKIDWMTELRPAMAKAKETGRPIMIDFYATWCGPCKLLDAKTYSDDRVAAASTNWLMVRIDVDKNQGLSQYYSINSIPTIVLLNAEGKEVRRETGFIEVGPMLTLMDHTQVK